MEFRKNFLKKFSEFLEKFGQIFTTFGLQFFLCEFSVQKFVLSHFFGFTIFRYEVGDFQLLKFFRFLRILAPKQIFSRKTFFSKIFWMLIFFSDYKKLIWVQIFFRVILSFKNFFFQFLTSDQIIYFGEIFLGFFLGGEEGI